MNEPTSTSRREFLRGVLRTAAAGGLVAGTSLLVIQKTGAACIRPVACGDCARFGRCDLPRANETRGRRNDAVKDQVNGQR